VLLSWAFENFKTVYPVIGPIEKERLYKGREDTVELKLAGPVVFTSPADRSLMLHYETVTNNPFIAPIDEGMEAGYLVISDRYGELHRVPLVTAYAYEKGNIFKRIWHSILLFFNR
jgi:D-alanyl-D-alanine carboxypeptidase (penicillin-binding protein 5/6)